MLINLNLYFFPFWNEFTDEPERVRAAIGEDSQPVRTRVNV